MAVTVTTNTLSTRVRYLNVSASTANTDAKDIVLAMANALIALGWSRYDTAGETAVVGSDDNAGVILRRECYDFAQSGHYNYLGLRLVGSGTNTYTFYLIQAADWSSTTSMSSFVSAATATVYAPNTTGNTRFLNFSLGGTIWIFDSGKTLLITSQSGDTLTKDLDSIWVVGEYKKDFGENVDSTTGYIHNGVFTNNRWFLDGCGVSVSDTNSSLLISFGGHLPSGPSSLSYGGFSAPSYTFATMGSSAAQTWNAFRFGLGAGYNQFVLTEAPSTGTSPQNSVTLTRSVTAPTTCGLGFTTRLLMGYLGYIGHYSALRYNSINSQFLGTFGESASIYKNSVAITSFSAIPSNTRYTIMENHADMLFSARGSLGYTWLNTIKEFPLDSTMKYVVFEPTLSCGTTNGVSSLASPYTVVTYSGPQYKFSMLGRIFDMKIFGPYDSEKYVFLDAMTIPCNADGFYQEGGTNKDFWLIPSGNNISFVMPK